MSQRILVPYEEPEQIQSMLAQVLPVAEQLAAELVLLRVNLPASPFTGCVDEGLLFSELKALQAQLPVATVPITLETNPGPVEQAVYQYAEQNGVDLIFAPELSPHLVFYRGAEAGLPLAQAQGLAGAATPKA